MPNLSGAGQVSVENGQLNDSGFLSSKHDQYADNFSNYGDYVSFEHIKFISSHEIFIWTKIESIFVD